VERGEILKTIYEAFGEDDMDTMRQHVHPDVEIVERLEVPGARVYHGVDEWEQGYAEEGETIDEFRVELCGVEELGGRCVADIVIRLRGKSSGAEVEERMAHLVDFEGDKVVRWRAFTDIEDARRHAREECVTELYDLWGRGELDAALARLHPEVEWAEPEETIGAQRGTGVERAREGVTQWEASFDNYYGELTGIESIGDRVLAEFIQRVQAGGSSVPLETVVFHVWGFRDGLPASMEMFFDREQALLQAAKS
jgi:ketosteroid isomerase-like protein